MCIKHYIGNMQRDTTGSASPDYTSLHHTPWKTRQSSSDGSIFELYSNLKQKSCDHWLPTGRCVDRRSSIITLLYDISSHWPGEGERVDSVTPATEMWRRTPDRFFEFHSQQIKLFCCYEDKSCMMGASWSNTCSTADSTVDVAVKLVSRHLSRGWPSSFLMLLSLEYKDNLMFCVTDEASSKAAGWSSSCSYLFSIF